MFFIIVYFVYFYIILLCLVECICLTFYAPLFLLFNFMNVYQFKSSLSDWATDFWIFLWKTDVRTNWWLWSTHFYQKIAATKFSWHAKCKEEKHKVMNVMRPDREHVLDYFSISNQTRLDLDFNLNLMKQKEKKKNCHERKILLLSFL